MKLLKSLLNNNIIAISSGGGHLTELKYSLSLLERNITNITFVVCRTPYTKNDLQQQKHFFIIDPHISKFKFLLNGLQSLYIFMKVRPRIVISTGAGICIPMMLIAKLFGCKLVFIETGACILTPSKTGTLLYKYSDLFIVQYQDLLKFYPKAVVASLL